MPTVKFFIRTKAKKEVLVHVYCRIRSGKDLDLTVKSGLQVHPNHFSNSNGFMRRVSDPNDRSRNDKDIRDLTSHIFDELAKISDKSLIKKDWLKTTVDKYWNPEKYKPKVENLFTYIQSFIDKAPSRINPKTGNPVCYKMTREYERTFYYLKSFSSDKDQTLDFKDIDLDFYDDFINYLRSKNLATNTIGKKIQTLKIFLNAAKEVGLNPHNYYKSKRFSSISEETDNIYLNQKELDLIYNIDLSKNPSLDKVRDLFLIECWTGLRFSDIKQITTNVIQNGNINLRQGKTGGKVVIPIHPVVEAILKKYKYKLPKLISNRKFNVYLKDIGSEAGINDKIHKTIYINGKKVSKSFPKYKLISSHTGRRSFASNNYLMGIPSITIMKITGHKTETSFLKYIKMDAQEHANRMKEIWASNNESNLKIVNK